MIEQLGFNGQPTAILQMDRGLIMDYVNKILQGGALELARQMPDESVHCIITSPPYWGLRDYGIGGQMGLEPTPSEHIEALVVLFRELRRVLRKDGLLFLNYGDMYATSANGRSAADTKAAGNDDRTFRDKPFSTICEGLKPKDLVGMPWRVALALQADGWYLRNDIIWHKPSAMPESVRDRFTRDHEYIFLFAKSRRYYFDQESVKVPSLHAGDVVSLGEKSFSKGQANGKGVEPTGNGKSDTYTVLPSRNRRTVWKINTSAYKAAHFATFPPKLIEPMLLAGCPEKACAECGAAWVRVVEKSRSFESGYGKAGNMPNGKNGVGLQGGGQTLDVRRGPVVRSRTTGFEPSCQCQADTTPGIVLDPFIGSGTVAQVAIENRRNWVGFELNPEYIELAEKRISELAVRLF